MQPGLVVGVLFVCFETLSQNFLNLNPMIRFQCLFYFIITQMVKAIRYSSTKVKAMKSLVSEISASFSSFFIPI